MGVSYWGQIGVFVREKGREVCETRLEFLGHQRKGILWTVGCCLQRLKVLNLWPILLPGRGIDERKEKESGVGGPRQTWGCGGGGGSCGGVGFGGVWWGGAGGGGVVGGVGVFGVFLPSPPCTRVWRKEEPTLKRKKVELCPAGESHSRTKGCADAQTEGTEIKDRAVPTNTYFVARPIRRCLGKGRVRTGLAAQSEYGPQRGAGSTWRTVRAGRGGKRTIDASRSRRVQRQGQLRAASS